MKLNSDLIDEKVVIIQTKKQFQHYKQNNRKSNDIIIAIGPDIFFWLKKIIGNIYLYQI